MFSKCPFPVLYIVSAILTVSLLINSCSQSKVEEKKVEPNQFVEAYTSGSISSQSPVTVVLDLPEDLSAISDNPPPQGIFNFKPKVAGKAYWTGPGTLSFEPKKPLESGVTYQVELDLTKLAGITNEQTLPFKFYFNVIPLSYKVVLGQMKAYDQEENKSIYLTGTLFVSDAVDESKLITFLSAKQESSQLDIQWLGETEKNTYQFVIDSIQRNDTESFIELSWKGKDNVSGFDDKGKIRQAIPSLNRFKLMNTLVFDLPDQYVRLEFSNPIDPKQDLTGLVYFSDNDPFHLVKEGNNLLIYPKSRLFGDKSIIIKKEIQTSKKVELENEIIQNVFFGQTKPEVRFLGKGTIVTGTEKWIVPFEAVNLSAVDVLIYKIYSNNIQQFLQVNDLASTYQIARTGNLVHTEKIKLVDENVSSSSTWISYALDMAQMISHEPGAIYRVEIRFKKEYSLYRCKGEDAGVSESVEENDLNNYYFNEYYYPNGFSWDKSDDPCHVSYYYSNKFIKKNVLATNLGLTIKEEEDLFLVYVNNLLDTKPINNVKISVYNYQQQKIGGGFTSPKGVSTVHYDGVPHLIVAEKDNQFAYQRVRAGSSLSYSRFETGGVGTSTGLKGFIYGDRGVWRPGDSLFLTLILDQSSKPLPDDHPVTMKLYNPKRKLIQSKTVNKGVNNFYAFKMTTHHEALTGVWRAEVKIGGSTFSKNVRVENIKPNRLKIDLGFDKEPLTRDNNVANLGVKWLHGGTAAGLKADINITLRSTKTVFDDYKRFNFEDPARYFSADEMLLFEGKLNNEGNKRVQFNLPPAKWSPGMLSVSFATKVYEHGGDFSIDQLKQIYSPFNTYIGIAGPETESRWSQLDTDVAHEFDVVTVDKSGKPLSVDDLEFEVYKLEWSWWYSSNNSNLANYISSHYDRKVASGRFNTKDGKGKFSMQVDYPNWGRYYVRVSKPDGGHQTGMKIYMDWPSGYSRSSREVPGSAEILHLSSSKEKYDVGEEISVNVPTPIGSRLLISLEKGNKQLRHWQMVATEEETQITFDATSGMAPNIYLFVSVIQPHSETINDLPIRMYGVVPIMVEDKNTVLLPKLIVPESVRPGDEYQIVVSESNQKQMTYTIAVVDEGLLDLTHFKTPVPHRHFFAKEALAVKTWDLYADVLGAFGGRMQKVFAIGGDMDLEASPEKKKANRFKPVVHFLGPFTLEGGKRAGHKIKMPNYIGSVRCMIVAGADGAYGHSEETFPVKQPLMVLATMPRVLAPGELVKLPVSIFVMDEDIKSVDVNIRTNALLSSNEPKQTISVEGAGEYLAYFDVAVLEKQGIGDIEVEVKSGSESAYYKVEIDVRNPNPVQYDVAYHMLKPGEKWNSVLTPVGIEGSNNYNLSVSGIPPLNLEKRIRYLIRYPYGCVEQTTSSVFPQLYLDKLMKLKPSVTQQMEANIQSAITRLYSFQRSNGGFSYWSGRPNISDWGTTYAGHFLLLAKEKGYNVPTAMINAWISYQQKRANEWKVEKYHHLSQAYRLYTLALAGKPNIGAMNRLRERSNLSTGARSRLAAAYALSGRTEVAKELVKDLVYSLPTDRNYWRYNYGSAIRDKAMMLETYVLLEQEDDAIPLFNQVADALKENRWMSTQTTAFALYAASHFVDADSGEDEFPFVYQWKNESVQEVRSEMPVFTSDFTEDEEGEIKLENISEGNLFATITKSGIPPLGKVLKSQKNLDMKITYRSMSGQTIDAGNLPHGTDFYAEILIKYPGTYGYIENMALSFVVPSGWEIINTRMLDVGSTLVSDHADYIDYKDDRVNFFFNISSSRPKRFVVLLNASYQGTYYMPASQCADMYNNDVNSNSGGGWIKVVKE